MQQVANAKGQTHPLKQCPFPSHTATRQQIKAMISSKIWIILIISCFLRGCPSVENFSIFWIFYFIFRIFRPFLKFNLSKVDKISWFLMSLNFIFRNYISLKKNLSQRNCVREMKGLRNSRTFNKKISAFLTLTRMSSKLKSAS